MGLFAKKPSPREAELSFDLLVGKQTTHSEKHYQNILPAEWFPQSGLQLTWPHAGTDWTYMLDEVVKCYLRLTFEIASRQPLIIVTPDAHATETKIREQLPERVTNNIKYVECPTNDTWARDHAFLTKIGSNGPELLNFGFNGWGEKFAYEYDNAINRHLFESGLLNGTYQNCLDFILEGGSIESDGAGTLLTTTSCLLNPNRNKTMTIDDIEQKLKKTLGAQRVLWLHHGHLAGDDTDGHIDTLARFATAESIVYVSCQDQADPHYEPLRQMEEELKSFTTRQGNPYQLFALPMPAPIYDEDNERLPATYANFLIMNKVVLMPTYNQPETDEAAHQIMQKAFSQYDIVDVDCTALIKQHGSLHCSVMQYPRGTFK